MSRRVAICILTFHRPEGLRRLLESIAALSLPDGNPDVSLVIVNNDPEDPSPREVVERAERFLPYPVELITESKRGLSHGRNRALARTLDCFDLIAFIDDDSTATPNWLAELLAVQKQSDADVVTGPVEPGFESTPPEWLVSGGFFKRVSKPTGTALRFAFTNNILIRTEVLLRTGIRFEPKLSLFGGDDTHFTRSLHRAGAVMIWADDAVVIDAVPDERANARWLIRRQERAGMTIAWIERDLRGACTAVPLLLAKAVVWTLLGTGLLCVGIVRGRATRVRARCWLGWGRGMILGLLGRSRFEYLEER